MSTEDGYTRFACDRAEKAHADGKRPIEYLGREDKRRKEWVCTSYTDTLGVSIDMTLCPSCAEKYRSIMRTHDRDMTEFMGEGV